MPCALQQWNFSIKYVLLLSLFNFKVEFILYVRFSSVLPGLSMKKKLWASFDYPLAGFVFRRSGNPGFCFNFRLSFSNLVLSYLFICFYFVVLDVVLL